MAQLAIALSEPVDQEVVRRLPGMMDAISLCITVAGRVPKEAYLELGIDKGHWSKILSGQNGFPCEKLEQLCDVMGNDIPLQWLAGRRGKGLHLLESEQQRQLRERDDRIRLLELREQALMDALRGGRGA